MPSCRLHSNLCSSGGGHFSLGVSGAARELGIQPSQIYQWRAKAAQQQSISDRERALAEENARLKRQLCEKTQELEITKKAAAYFARELK